MRYTKLIALLAALAATVVFTAEASAMYHPGMGRFMQRDPVGYVDGNNLHSYGGSNPLGGADPFGTDFVAIGDRNVLKSGRYHYLATYWRCDCPLKSGKGELFHTAGYTDAELKKICAGPAGISSNPNSAEQLGITQLDGSSGWSVWAVGRLSFTGSGGADGGGEGIGVDIRVWVEVDLFWIAFIRYDGARATKTMPIYEAKPEEVKSKWNDVVGKARSYEWAEQDGFDANEAAPQFKNWPRSNYKWNGTNSNTFIRTIIRRSGLPWQEMSARRHPGHDTPQQNYLAGPTGFAFGVPEQTPWKGRNNAKPRPGGPVPNP
jgi:hypothetical protein